MGRKATNEIGNVYGMLTVIDSAGVNYRGAKLWECVCSCGNRRVVRGEKLRAGDITSCGCRRNREYETGQNSINEIGNIYGELTVIGRDENIRKYDEKGKAIRVESSWICQCTCGNITKARGRLLRSGNTQSCGCKGYGSQDAAFHGLYLRMKSSAQKRKYSWNITEEFAREITSKNCFYCGVAPSQVARNRGRMDYLYNGIDRFDNSRGYEIDNVVPCCKVCNSAKNTFSFREFKNWIEVVYHNLISSDIED